MFKLIKQVIIMLSFGGSLATIVNTPDHIKFISLNNKQWMSQPTIINLHTN